MYLCKVSLHNLIRNLFCFGLKIVFYIIMIEQSNSPPTMV